jgi:hypothetical protein
MVLAFAAPAQTPSRYPCWHEPDTVRRSAGDRLHDLSSAAGVDLTGTGAPVLEMSSAKSQPGDNKKREVIYLRDEGSVYLAGSAALAETVDYPSGHATFACTVGLTFAELAPARVGPILACARAFGESWAVYDVHTASAEGEARAAGSAHVAPQLYRRVRRRAHPDGRTTVVGLA